MWVFIGLEGVFVTVWFEFMTRGVQVCDTTSTVVGELLQHSRLRHFVTAVIKTRLVACTVRGCLQRQVLLPLFWSMVEDNLVVDLNYHGIYAQEYADDV